MNTINVEKPIPQSLSTGVSFMLMLVVQFIIELMHDESLATMGFWRLLSIKWVLILTSALIYVLMIMAVPFLMVFIIFLFKKSSIESERRRAFLNGSWGLLIINSLSHDALFIFITLIGFVIFIIGQAIVSQIGWVKTTLKIVMTVIIGFFVVAYHLSVEETEKSKQVEIIQGYKNNYSIQIPRNWKIERNTKYDFDIEAYHRSLYLGVIFEEADLGDPSVIAETAQQTLKEKTTDLSLSEKTTFELDGREWIQFTAKARIDNLPVTYLFYVYSGAEGSVQLVGWTAQNLFDRDVEKLRAIMQTFHFAKKASAKNKSALSNPVSAKEALDIFFQGTKHYHKKEYAEAYKDWLVAAEANILEAYNNLGYLNYYGLGVEENKAEGIRYWKNAAANGDVESQIHLARAYIEENGVLTKDFMTAYMWIEVAKHFLPRIDEYEFKKTYKEDIKELAEECNKQLTKAELKKAGDKAKIQIADIKKALKTKKYKIVYWLD